MTKLHCLAVDDEPFALDILADDIRRIPELDLVKARSAYEAKKLLDYSQFDLIFLDIQMPGISGLQFLTELQAPPLVILTTAFDQYALKAFELNVVDYLLKPISFERLALAVQRAISLHQLRTTKAHERANQSDFLLIKSGYHTQRIAYDDILYVEGMKDYVKIYTSSKKQPVLTRMNVKAIELLLPVHLFSRIHQSFIVSLNKVELFQKKKLRIGNQEFPIGARFANDFYDKIGSKIRLG
jgi:DNA-binding LytR/AlgR family response regulator